MQQQAAPESPQRPRDWLPDGADTQPAALPARGVEVGSRVPRFGPDRPHVIDVRAYGVTAEGIEYDLPLTPREAGLCPVEGCHCQDPLPGRGE